MNHVSDSPTTLKVKSSDARDSKVIIILADDDGRTFEVPLSIFDVSTLVSMLYHQRADAMKQKPDTAPEVMLPITEIQFAENSQYQLMRIFVNPNIYQDYAIAKDSPLAETIRLFSEFGAKIENAPDDWGGPQSNH